jgi:predicted transcriptional regulator
MAIIRRHNPRRPSMGGDSIDLIDSPDKLLAFVKQKGLTEVPLDVEGVARALGIDVRGESLKGDLSGILRREPLTDRWALSVNVAHHPNRQRYTIAHELAHYFLHRHLKMEFQDTIFFRGSESTREEMQANSFASEILIPEADFRQRVREGTNRIEDLAQIYAVSTLALRIRAKNLGMSGHGL